MDPTGSFKCPSGLRKAITDQIRRSALGLQTVANLKHALRNQNPSHHDVEQGARGDPKARGQSTPVKSDGTPGGPGSTGSKRKSAAVSEESREQTSPSAKKKRAEPGVGAGKKRPSGSSWNWLSKLDVASAASPDTKRINQLGASISTGLNMRVGEEFHTIKTKDKKKGEK